MALLSPYPLPSSPGLQLVRMQLVTHERGKYQKAVVICYMWLKKFKIWKQKTQLILVLAEITLVLSYDIRE